MYCLTGLLCCVLWFVGNSCSTQLTCDARRTPVLKLSVISRRNKTGHWTAQVNLGHKAGKQASDPWEVDVERIVTTCDDYEFIQVDTTVTAPSPYIGWRIPSPGYQLITDLGYYKMHNETKTWKEAIKICEEEGAHLLIINSEEEAKVVDDLMLNSSTTEQRNWVGISDQSLTEEYVTIFGDPLESTGYPKWRTTQPDTARDEDCVYYWYKSGLGDITCEDAYPFICEKEV